MLIIFDNTALPDTRYQSFDYQSDEGSCTVNHFREMMIYACRLVHGDHDPRLSCINILRLVVTYRNVTLLLRNSIPDSKVHGANMGSIWGRQNPGGPHVGPMNFVIWDRFYSSCTISNCSKQICVYFQQIYLIREVRFSKFDLSAI